METKQFRIKIFLLALSALNVNGARKYDIEAEAHSIYGTDLKTVLHKFRHSPEYLKILGERGEQISNQLSSILAQLVFFFSNEMKTKIIKTLKPNEDVDKLRQKLLLRSKYNPLRTRLRQDEDEAESSSPSPSKEEVTRTPHEILDEYVAERRKLSASYINHFRGMGYEYFGRVLHGLVTNLGGDAVDPESRFTHGDIDGSTLLITTEHVTLHTVSTPSDITPFVVSTFPADDEGENAPPPAENEPEHQEK